MALRLSFNCASMNSRQGSHAEVWAGGRGGGFSGAVCALATGGEPVATPGEFASANWR